MAFLGSLFSTVLPAIAGIAGAVPAITGAISSISQASKQSHNIVNPADTANEVPSNQNLANSSDTGKDKNENTRLSGLVDSLLSRLGQQNQQIKQLVEATPIKEAVHHVAKKTVNRIKKRSPKYEELAAALGL